MKCEAFMNTNKNNYAMNKGALIDNYDSFTYNLKALLESNGAEIDVFRNDKVSTQEISNYDYLVFSPGPSIPSEAGELLHFIDHFKYEKPMLGICLGMQAIAEVFGGKLELLEKPLHGVSKMVTHFGDDLFQGLNPFFEAGRYHSWVISEKELPAELKITAVSVEKKIMSIQHDVLPIYGLQFHPESVLTETGDKIIQNFLKTIQSVKNETVVKQII